MARPAVRFNPRDPREWTEDTRRRRDGRAEIEAQLREMDDEIQDAVEELEAFYAEIYEDTQEMYADADRIWRER